MDPEDDYPGAWPPGWWIAPALLGALLVVVVVGYLSAVLLGRV